MYDLSVHSDFVRNGGGSLNASTAVTRLLSYWLQFVVWLWGFADSIIVYQNITLLDVTIFSLVVSLTVDVVLWVNSKSAGGDY